MPHPAATADAIIAQHGLGVPFSGRMVREGVCWHWVRLAGNEPAPELCFVCFVLFLVVGVRRCRDLLVPLFHSLPPHILDNRVVLHAPQRVNNAFDQSSRAFSFVDRLGAATCMACSSAGTASRARGATCRVTSRCGRHGARDATTTCPSGGVTYGVVQGRKPRRLRYSMPVVLSKTRSVGSDLAAPDADVGSEGGAGAVAGVGVGTGSTTAATTAATATSTAAAVAEVDAAEYGVREAVACMVALQSAAASVLETASVAAIASPRLHAGPEICCLVNTLAACHESDVVVSILGRALVRLTLVAPVELRTVLCEAGVGPALWGVVWRQLERCVHTVYVNPKKPGKSTSDPRHRSPLNGADATSADDSSLNEGGDRDRSKRVATVDSSDTQLEGRDSAQQRTTTQDDGKHSDVGFDDFDTLMTVARDTSTQRGSIPPLPTAATTAASLTPTSDDGGGDSVDTVGVHTDSAGAAQAGGGISHRQHSLGDTHLVPGVHRRLDSSGTFVPSPASPSRRSGRGFGTEGGGPPSSGLAHGGDGGDGGDGGSTSPDTHSPSSAPPSPSPSPLLWSARFAVLSLMDAMLCGADDTARVLAVVQWAREKSGPVSATDAAGKSKSLPSVLSTLLALMNDTRCSAFALQALVRIVYVWLGCPCCVWPRGSPTTTQRGMVPRSVEDMCVGAFVC